MSYASARQCDTCDTTKQLIDFPKKRGKETAKTCHRCENIRFLNNQWTPTSYGMKYNESPRSKHFGKLGKPTVEWTDG